MAEMTFAPVQTQPAQGQWTYADYLKLPNDGNRYEMIEGVMYVSNAPNSDHQFTVTELGAELRDFTKKNKLGRVLVAPFEVHLSETTRPVQPDILFVRGDRWPTERVAFFAGAPDLVVEVISPSSVRTDRVTKRFEMFRFREWACLIKKFWVRTTQILEFRKTLNKPT